MRHTFRHKSVFLRGENGVSHKRSFLIQRQIAEKRSSQKRSDGKMAIR